MISDNLIPYNYTKELIIEGYNFDNTKSIVLIGSAPKTIMQKPAIDPNKESANITSIHVQDKYAYVIEDSTTLHILDIEKPDQPNLLGRKIRLRNFLLSERSIVLDLMKISFGP